VETCRASAGLTKGAVYWHFAGKSDLFLALLEESSKQQARALPEAVRCFTVTDDSVGDLAAVLTDQFAACKENRDWPRLFLEFSASAGPPRV
jgi:AcrR family transcriptional regulator